MYVKQRFTFNHLTEVRAQTFSRGRRKLIQNYLYKSVEMTLRVHIQCNNGGIECYKTSKISSWTYIFKSLFRWANMLGKNMVKFYV